MAEISQTASSSRAILRETEGLAACLERDRAEVLRWKDENPLRLVAAALVDIRGRAARKDLQERIVPEIVAPDEWNNWWKKVQPALSDSPHFDYDPKNARRGVRRESIPSEIEPVSLSPIAPPARKKQSSGKPAWLKWLVSGDDVPMPKSPLRMNEGLAKGLRELDAELMPTAVSKLCVGIEMRAFGAIKASPVAWVKVFSAVLARWAKLPTNPNVSTDRIVSLTARLSGVSKIERGDWESLIEPLANYTSANVSNSQEIANAIIASSITAPRETTALLEQIHRLLGELVRKDFWLRLITSDSGQISDWLNNRWRNIPADDEKAEVATCLAIASEDSALIGNLDLMLSGEWGFADIEQRQHLFKPVFFGWGMRRALMPECRRILRELAEQVGKNGASATDALMRAFEEFTAAAAKDRLKRQGDDYENRLAVEGGRLRDTESELENAITRFTFLQRDNRTERTGATLEITGDAIAVLGDALQGLASSDIPKSHEVGNLESKMVLALSTLDTKPFGEIGEIAPFDPEIHQAEFPPEIETPIKVVAPGWIYSKGNDVSVPVVPMKVQRET